VAPICRKPSQARKKVPGEAPANVADHRGNRHGRSEQARTAILEAADNLLVERGFAGVTMEGIAAAAGVAKQTIYRWWKSKTDVLMDAFLEDVEEGLFPPDRGDLAADLRYHLLELTRLLATSDTGAVFRALMAEAQHDSDLAVRLRSQFIEPQRMRDLIPFQNAVKRGELPQSYNIGAAAEELLSPIYYRLLVSGQPMSDTYLEGLVQRLLCAEK